MKMTVDVQVFERGRKKPEYTLNTDLNGEISLLDFLEFTKQTLVVTADVVLKEEQALGFDPDPVITVDGQNRKPIALVNPLGKIEITAKAEMKEIVRETYDSLLYRSPYYTGRYKTSHLVFLNGHEVASDMSSLLTWLSSYEWKENDLIRFVNIQPYARKLERMGVTEQRTKTRERTHRKDPSKKMLQPNGVYFLTTRAVSSKYKRNANIKFSFISGSQLGISGSFAKGRKGKPGRAYLYPTITITADGGSI